MALTDAGSITEFYEGFNGTCGECALEVAKAAARGQKSNLDDMIAITHDMQAHGQASANGASTPFGLAAEARRLGLTVLTEWDYSEPMTQDWHGLIMANAGINPIIIEIAQAHNLVDIETGAADEAGVHYHFICILGKKPDGYIANDGDNPQARTKFSTYSYADLASAVPCGVVMIQAQQGATPMAVPAGWSDVNGVIHAPGTSNVVTNAFAQYIRDNPWRAWDIPLTNDVGMPQLEQSNPALGGGDEQVFRGTVLEFTPAKGVFEMWVGQELLDVRAARDKAEAAVSAAAVTEKTQADQIASLQAQLAAALGKPSLDPTIAADLSTALNALAPLGTVLASLSDAQKKLG